VALGSLCACAVSAEAVEGRNAGSSSSSSSASSDKVGFCAEKRGRVRKRCDFVAAGLECDAEEEESLDEDEVVDAEGEESAEVSGDRGFWVGGSMVEVGRDFDFGVVSG
jgi:hypothetical protein